MGGGRGRRVKEGGGRGSGEIEGEGRRERWKGWMWQRRRSRPYLHYLQHPQPRYFPPKWRNNSGEGNEIVAGWYSPPPPPTHSLSCLPQPTHSETSSQHHRSNLILIFSQLGHHIHHLFTSTSDMNPFYRVR